MRRTNRERHAPHTAATTDMGRWIRGVAVAAALMFVAGCGNGSAQAETVVADASDRAGIAPASLVDVLRVNDASSLATAIQDIDFALVTTSTEFTVLAPNDEAFLALTADQTAELLTSPEQLVELLRQHVVAELLTAAELGDRTSITTVGGTLLEIGAGSGGLQVGAATVVRPDADARAGMALHVIDTVLQP